MFLKSLVVKNFRNYKDISIELDKNINIIYGHNAQGKTNLLESIYFLALSKSHRSFIDNCLIKKGEDISKIDGVLDNNGINKTFRVVLSSSSKKLFIDNFNIKKVSDYISNINVIIFIPDDLDFIKGSPVIRRRFLNVEIGQLYNKYIVILNDYNKLVKMKNNYLKENSYYDSNYLISINELLIKNSVLIYIMRKKFIDKINHYARKIFLDLSGLDGFNIKYKTAIDLSSDENIIYKNLEIFSKLNYDKEIKYKKNLLGPNSDDLEFYIDDMDLKKYGSQGQQRLAVLAIKLSEIEIFKSYLGTSPILLLDDVFSELDNLKKNNLLKYVDSNIQTIITTTDFEDIDESIITKAKLFKIENGNII